MFKETKKFFGPQLTPDLSSGINIPNGLAVCVTPENFSHTFYTIGDPIQDPNDSSKPFPLFGNVLDIQTDAQNAITVPQVSVIAARSLTNTQSLNRCEQSLPFEPSLFSASFRRAVSTTTTVPDAIQACVNELNKIYIPISTDANRRIFEVDGIAARPFPLGLYTYENDAKLSLKKGVIYAASVNNENLQVITTQPVGIYQAQVNFIDSLVVLFSDSTIRCYNRLLEITPFHLESSNVVIQLTPTTYQSVAQTQDVLTRRLFVCKVNEMKITTISIGETGIPVGTVISNFDIDTIAHNNLPIIGIVNLKPQVMDTSFTGAAQTLLIAEQEKNAIVSQRQSGSFLFGWTYFPHPVRGISTSTVTNDFGGFDSKTITYANPVDSTFSLASRVKFSEIGSSSCSFNASTGGRWSFTQTGARSFSSLTTGVATFNNNAGNSTSVETRTGILFNTSFLNESRIDVLKARLCFQFETFTDGDKAIPFSRNINTGALLACTCEIHQFTTATPGVVVDSDLDSGVGGTLTSFVIPFSNPGSSGSVHPPTDPDGQVRGGWAYDFPLTALNKTGYTGLFVKLVGFPTDFSANYTISSGVSTTMKLILVLSSDISSTTPTTFLSNFPADGTARYEERHFLGYILDKQQEFVVPIENIKQVCGSSRPFTSQENTPKVRTINVEFPRLCYVKNSIAKTQNGSTYVPDSYSSPFITTGGRALKVGEFFDSRDGSVLTTKTKRLILTFDRLNYWYHSMRIVDGKCKLQIHIQSNISRSIDNEGNITVISNPNKFSLLTFINSTNPENGIKIINGGTIFKSLGRDMSLDTNGDGIVTESDLGRDYIVEWDVTDFIVTLRKSSFSSAGFIFRNENERQFFDLASSDNTIDGGEISSLVEVYDELAPRLLFEDSLGYSFKKNGYKSMSLPPLVPAVVL